ncbi:MAG: ribonuclease J [Candidatus Moraniibacteriota bacterium]|nr:MAG: ribonuclease J [Candidatus Moranbacteria bacterium]
MFIDTIRRDRKTSPKKVNPQDKEGHTLNAKKSVERRKTEISPLKNQAKNVSSGTNQASPTQNENTPQRKRSAQGGRRGGQQKRTPSHSFGGSTHTLRGGADRVTTRQDQSRVEIVPPVKPKTLRVIPIGGQEEVGRNMAVFEYDGDIVIVDMGMQFPEEDMPGIDYIVPNIDYLKGKESRIRGVIFTHGHLDHIGAAPILLEKLGYPPIVGRDLTIAMLKRKIEEHNPNAASKLKVIHVKSFRDTVRLGQFQAGFFDVEHSIMDAIGVVLATDAGTIVHLGDWTIGHDSIEKNNISYTHLSRLPRPTILMLESLGAINKNPPKSEKQVQKNLEDLIAEAPGRVIIGTFSSQIKRVSYLLSYAEKIGKKVALDGYSMRTNIEIARELGYLNVQKDTLIPVSDIHKYPENRIVVICTGAQGEANAVFNRIVTGNHRFITLQKTDTIVFSSSVIPGNERSVQRLKDNLYRKCENVIHSDIMDIHMSGHSTAEDIREMIRQIKPSYFLPVYANHFFLKEAKKRAVEIGYPVEDVFVLDNGNVIDFKKGERPKVLKEKADSSYVFIDGLGIGDIGHVVLRDRQMLSEDGMFAITIILDSKTKEVVGNMQVTSRGFILVKENFDLVNETKRRVGDIIKRTTSKDTKLDPRFVENAIRDQIGEFLFQKTQRRPMILPVVVEV